MGYSPWGREESDTAEQARTRVPLGPSHETLGPVSASAPAAPWALRDLSQEALQAEAPG